jgi:hypothetical protein
MSNPRMLLAYDEMADLELETTPAGTSMIHLTVRENQWSLSKFKEWKKDWIVIKQHLKAKGIDELFTLIPLHDEKVNKFQRMFGFEPILTFADSVLYRQRI